MNTTFGYLVTTFLTTYLSSERGLSPNTVASYADCMRLLVNYLCDRLGVEPEASDMRAVTPETVTGFLDWLQEERGNSATTRNQRLAAIKSLFHFLARNVPELLHAAEHVQALRAKTTDGRPPPSLSVEQVQAILARPVAGTLLGARDRALLHLMYNTGARVQELADLDVADLRLEALPSATLTGKGRKTRVVPLWDETVAVVRQCLGLREQAGIDSECLFLSSLGGRMTRSAIARRVASHARSAADACPSLEGRNVTPHTFRHTTALHLVEAGNDVFVLKDWLGHASIKTSCQYVDISLERRSARRSKGCPRPAAKTRRSRAGGGSQESWSSSCAARAKEVMWREIRPTATPPERTAPPADAAAGPPPHNVRRSISQFVWRAT